MENAGSKALAAAIITLLRPLVRILLARGVPFRTFSETAKWVYVDVAAQEFGIPGRKQSDSRISVLTGLSRKEVKNVRVTEEVADRVAAEHYSRAARVITAWLRDREFANGEWNPKALPFEAEGGASFSALVQRYGGDVTPRAVLDELLRVGAVTRTEDGRIQLVHRGYVPHQGEEEKLNILGTDVADLIATIGHNIDPEVDERLFQRKVAYDNLPASSVPGLRETTAGKAQALLESLDRLYASHDRDANPEVEGQGRKRVVLGIYYREQDMEPSAAAGEPAPGSRARGVRRGTTGGR